MGPSAPLLSAGLAGSGTALIGLAARRGRALRRRRLLAVLEVMQQVALVDLVILIIELRTLGFERRKGWLRRFGNDVGRNAYGLNRTAVGRVITGRGQAQR